MADSIEVLRLASKGRVAGSPLQRNIERTEEEESCLAFGYLRGLHDRALAVQFRFREGNSLWLPYSWLGPWQHDPSEGLLLKFVGDTVILVIIRGSNLAAPVNEESVNLTDGGFQRHRIVFVKEMDEVELRKAGEREATIDRIEVAEFDSRDEIRKYLKIAAPAFLIR